MSTPPAANASPTVADQLLDYLALEGARTLFGIPGGGIAHLLERVNQRGDFDYVVSRHETGAAYMADGYFRATGRLCVVLVTSGPGGTNALTGAMNAQASGSAVVVLTGEVAEVFLGRGYLQDGTDCGLNLRDLYAAATAFSADIPDPTSAPTLIEEALRTALALPRRAVRLGIPDNVAAAQQAPSLSPRPPASPRAYRSAPPDDAPTPAVRRVLGALAAAKRPLLLLGSGCRAALRDAETARALRRFVEWWQIPAMTTSDGKGVFPESHPLSLRSYGFAGCMWPQYWMTTSSGGAAHDALLVLGSSLGELATYRWNPMLMPQGPLIQVDADAARIGRGFPVTEGIVAEAGAFLRALWDQAAAWPRDVGTIEQRRQSLAALKEQHSPFIAPTDYEAQGTPLHPAALCRSLNKLLPEDALVFVDSGNCVGWALHYLVIDRRQEFHSALSMGPMGFGTCAVIGARHGCPDRLCVALTGDGAFLMHLGEISTAAARGIGAVWVVLADNNLSMVSQGMAALFSTDPAAGRPYPLGGSDLAATARGLGAEAWDVRNPEDLHLAWPQLVQGAAAGKPQVVVAHIDTAAAPPYYAAPYWQPKVE
ncbi:thiamine pyrophosphate-binding protein [Sabulicella rubraurantiaca]|uniref:thiamine pyrophosphate-binding protein n=1 Tax=Sabulicella rubraurantiaca TaxID=2811429 RepID=UPI001A96C396|nr:thiamine pyrophosphate-binding protein [Sabulicella rubraurantiaca]